MADTKDQLLRHLLNGPATASDLADKAGISTTAARRHAEDLTEEGHVSPFFRQEGIGRPSKHYEITEEGRERFPRSYDVAAEHLIQAVLDHHGEEGLEDTMHAVAQNLAKDLEDKIPPEASLQERVQATSALLEDLGFPTHLERHEDRWVLVRRDCIFLKLARKHRDAVCQDLDTTLLENLLGAEVSLDGCLPDGQGTCRHIVEKDNARPSQT